MYDMFCGTSWGFRYLLFCIILFDSITAVEGQITFTLNL